MKSSTTLLLLIVSLLFSGDLTANQILDSLEKNQNPKSSEMVMTQIVHRSNGSVAESKLTNYSILEGEKGLMVYTTPARIKGMKILTLNDGDDIWFYTPRTGRVRKIASHQKNQSVNGSDFSYDDLSSKDQRESYDSKIISKESVDGIECIKLELIPKEGIEKSYSKIILYVDSKRWLPLKSEFFDDINELWKVLTMKEISKVGAYWTPKKIIMKNILKDSYTEMITESVEYDKDIDESMFTERYLNR